MSQFLSLTQAPHASFYNGGSTVTSREYWMRPTQIEENGPRIPTAVANMNPGEFRPIWVNSSGGIFRVYSPENNSDYNILDWTPRAAFDQATQQIILGGKRIKFKVIAYSDKTGDWREMPMPLDNGASRASETGHWYGNTDEDSSGNVYLGFAARHFRLNPVTEAYTTLANHETTNGGNGSMYAWSPNLFTQGGLVRYAGDAERWLRYNPVTNTWDRPTQNIGNDMHALLEYQPTCDRFLLVGGSLTPNMARLVTRDGVNTLVTSAPDPLNFSSGSWIVAHPSGCWLVTTYGASRKIWAVWPNPTNTDVTWQDLGVSPDESLSLPTAAWDGVRGLIYIVATTGLYAYKPPVLQNPYNASKVNSDLVFTYSLISRLINSVNFQYAVFNSAAKELTFSYSTSEKVLRSIDFNYSLLERINNQKEFSYLLYNKVNSDKSFVYSFNDKVSSDKSFLYEVLQKLNSDVSFSYLLKQNVSRNLTTGFTVEGILRVLRDLNIRYSVLQEVDSDTVTITVEENTIKEIVLSEEQFIVRLR